MNRTLSLPLSIVIAGVLIGVGVYCGLRERAPHHLSSGLPSPLDARQAPRGGPSRGTGTGRPLDGVATDAARHVAAVLESRRQQLARECHVGTERTQWTFGYTFDAEGTQVIRGISEPREQRRPQITACLLRAIEPLTIPAPGVTVSFEVPFSLP